MVFEQRLTHGPEVGRQPFESVECYLEFACRLGLPAQWLAQLGYHPHAQRLDFVGDGDLGP
ncbi:MAG: hypothetical protein GEU86_16325 [Actinophytocola sp.]|nr:hypothetical protein [Actinophytocola sp.]